MRISRRFISIAGLALFGLSQQASADTLYSQPFDGTGNVYASQNDTNTGGFGNFATVYDNFTLGSSATINQIAFTGGYYNPVAPGTISGFTVTIYADNTNAPGVGLYSEFVTGNAGENLIGDFGVSFIGTYTLSASFAASAGTQYWLSIVPDIGFPPQWGWATATGGDGIAYQNFFGSLSQVPNDFAFTLSGAAAVPAPIAGAGLPGMVSVLLGGGLLGWWRRKRTASAALASA